MAEKHIFWEVPQSSLHHVKVAAAHAVHESRQEVRCQAAVQKKKNTLTQWKVNANKANRFFSGIQRAFQAPDDADLPGIILDAAQGQTEGHVPTQLLRRSHESLQIVLQQQQQPTC